jgi:capsular exopolysaccharide synthesis family protein
MILPGELGRPLPTPVRRPVSEAPEETVDWIRGVHILRKHWRLSTLFALVVAGSVTLVTLLMEPVFQPEAKVEVDPPGTELFTMQGAQPGINSAEFLETQVQELQSDALALVVIRQLHLDQVREFVSHRVLEKAKEKGATDAGSDTAPRLSAEENVALRAFRTKLEVTRESASRLITVSFASHDPQLAALITNTLVNSFIERSYRIRHEAIMQSSLWLQRQIDDVKKRVEEDNQALAEFSKANGIADVGDGNTFSVQMAELDKQLTQVQAERIQAQAFLSKVQNGGVETLPQAGADQVVQGLTERLAEAQASLADSLAIYGKNNPNAKKWENQVNVLQAQLERQRETILAQLRTTYAAARSREVMLDQQMKNASKQLVMVAQYTNLKKEADASAALYNALLGKVKEAGIAAESKSSNVRMVDQARVLDKPTRPKVILNLAVGFLVAIFGGVVLAFIRERMDTRVHTPQDIRKSLGVAAVSVVPVISPAGQGAFRLMGHQKAKEPTMFVLDRPHSPEAEAVRGLQTSLKLSRTDRPPQVVLIASASPGEGKTTVAVNLAISLAQRSKTCLVDADLRRSSVARSFGLDCDIGLGEVLTGTAALEQVAVQAPLVPNLILVPAVESSVNAGVVLTTESMGEVLRELRRGFEYIVIDSPPVVPFAEARALATLVDGVVLVGRAGYTDKEAIVRTMELLSEVRSAPVLDVVLNAANMQNAEYRYYGHGSYKYKSA